MATDKQVFEVYVEIAKAWFDKDYRERVDMMKKALRGTSLDIWKANITLRQGITHTKAAIAELVLENWPGEEVGHE